MHRLLPFLLVIAVLFCGMHVGESDVPHEAVQHEQSATVPSDAGDEHDGEGLADSGHHHCPVAPALSHSALACVEAPRAMLVAAAVRPLTSLPQAPPTEPPSA